MTNYKIITDSSSDIPTDIREKHGIDYFQMGIVVDGEQMPADLDWKTYTPDELYGWLSAGRKLKTNLITVETFINKIKQYFEKGIDVLYLGCSTALTGSLNSFNLAKEILMEEYPSRRMEAVQTYAAAATLGMLVVDAAREQEKGADIDTVMKWVEDHRFFYNQFCTVDTLTFLKDAGRIKGTAAFFGNIVGVKPVFISDRKGNNLVIEKLRGTKASLNAIYQHIMDVIDLNHASRVVIAHSGVSDRAELLKARFLEAGIKEVIIVPLGPIIGITCGPGTISTFCYGKEVTRYEGDGISVK